MKNNAIVRIILFSLAILILLGILLAGLAFGLFIYNSDPFVSNADEMLPIASDGWTAASAVDASEIQNIEIEWAAGSIKLLRDENATAIIVAESKVEESKYQMVCQKSGDTLKIQYCKDSITFPSFGINIDFSKDLVITVPAGWICDTLEIDAASANVSVTDLTIHEVDFDGASGVCVFENCHVDTLDLDTASGDVNFYGTLDVLECDAASANFRAVLDRSPSRLDFDGVSGDLDVTLPENSGFSVSLDSMSGNFSSDFPTSITNGNHTYGDGSCRIHVNGVSGNVIIRNGGYHGANITEPMVTLPLCTDPTCTDAGHDHN